MSGVSGPRGHKHLFPSVGLDWQRLGEPLFQRLRAHPDSLFFQMHVFLSPKCRQQDTQQSSPRKPLYIQKHQYDVCLNGCNVNRKSWGFGPLWCPCYGAIWITMNTVHLPDIHRQNTVILHWLLEEPLTRQGWCPFLLFSGCFRICTNTHFQKQALSLPRRPSLAGWFYWPFQCPYILMGVWGY